MQEAKQTGARDKRHDGAGLKLPSLSKKEGCTGSAALLAKEGVKEMCVSKQKRMSGKRRRINGIQTRDEGYASTARNVLEIQLTLDG